MGAVRMRRLGTGVWIWGTAIVLSLAFTGWYHNWRGPLTPAEIDAYMEQLAALPDSDPQMIATMRRFLNEDDGREFVMLNVIRFHAEDQPHPETGEPTDPRALMTTYSNAFIGRLLLSAGHPVLVADKTGPYVDTFGTEEATPWDIISMVRYRSRRDLMEAATYEGFPGAHLFKTAAIHQTFNFPTQTQIRTSMGPGVLVPFLLLFAAALAHLVVVTRRGG